MFNMHFSGLDQKNVKKMLSKNRQSSEIQKVISWTLPKLHTGKINYIQFSAYDPIEKRLRAKRIKVNRIKNKAELKRYCQELIARLIIKLSAGWSPWEDELMGTSMASFKDVCDKFYQTQDRYYKDGIIKRQSLTTFYKYMRSIEKYNSSLTNPIRYIYEFDKSYITKLIDHFYYDKEVSVRTRNNYRDFIAKFCGWCVERDFMAERPDLHTKKIKARTKEKSRTTIPEDVLNKIFDYLRYTNKHYLLACYVIYYCFIRPNEMAALKLSDINIEEQTIFISGKISKNSYSGKVTIPSVLIELINELKLLDEPKDHYIFSNGFMPGPVMHKSNRFVVYWSKIRQILEFGNEYKFYSLKDTGITRMLNNGVQPIVVRDQARHHSLDMTGIYTPDSNMSAPMELKDYR